MLALALLAGLFAATHASAQTIGGKNIRVSLVADGPPVPGKTWTLALHFIPSSPEWHGYWSNPGDAGVGMRLKWQLPEGWQAGEPLYPVPHRLEIAGLMNHVFEGDYAVLVPIAVPASAAVGNAAPIHLEVDYLACTDSICVPERAQLSLDPSIARADPRFTGWRAALAPPLDSAARYTVTEKLLRVAVPLPAAVPVSDPHIFVKTRDLVNYAAPQNFARKGDWLIGEIPLAEGAGDPGGIEGIVALDRQNGLRFTGAAGEVPTGGEPVATAAAAGGILASFWIALGLALLGGLILNVMPCVFPILSLKALALARAGGSEQEARREGLAYSAGVVLACMALGGVILLLRAGGEQVGWAFQLQEPAVVVALLVLALAIAANLAGVFELPSLSFTGKGGQSGAFATGLLAAFVATPCTGPFMAAAMGAALLLPWWQGLLLFAALGLGLALPFLLLGFIPPLRRLLPRPGAWMDRFRKAMAVPMALTALALVWLCWRLGGAGFAALALALAALVVLAVRFVWSVKARKTGPALALTVGALALAVSLPFVFRQPAAASEAGLLNAQPFTEAALAEARASGKPVFVWLTADWCLTCKVNENAAIERAATKAAFDQAGVVALVGDWTRRDEAITRFLTAQGAAGVPLYLWYPAGSSQPRQLPQVLTPDLLASLANGTG